MDIHNLPGTAHEGNDRMAMFDVSKRLLLSAC